jgi:hypothetical protein
MLRGAALLSASTFGAPFLLIAAAHWNSIVPEATHTQSRPALSASRGCACLFTSFLHKPNSASSAACPWATR